MKVLASWLQEYVGEKLTARQMAERLEKSGIEIEQIISSPKLDKRVVVALVTKVAQHPGADRLRLAEVSTGKATVKLVCGAPNLEVGQKVALAQVGTVLPDGMEIKAAPIRGEMSNGMLCSPQELGMGDDHSGILVLAPSLPAGKALCDIALTGEILDLTSAANRFDLQSLVGLAREVAARGSGDLREPKAREPKAGKPQPTLVSATDDELALRYIVASVTVPVIKDSPQWMQDRLLASGMRPINVVVDITNYVMLEYGQPLHAFDASKVSLPLSVRLAKPGETLTTLDGSVRKLTDQDLVIADKAGPIGLAGVMGGTSSEITAKTTEIILESATFNRVAVRKTAVRHGIRTEASARFERGLPTDLAPLGLARALDLLAEHAQAKFDLVSDTLNQTSKTNKVHLRLDRLEKLLGMPVKNKIVVQLLTKLGFEAEETSELLKVSVPWWRPDVKLEEDLVEEVGRLLGYDDLPATLPPLRAATVDFDHYWAKLWQLKAGLRSLGLFEVVTYSFVSQQQLEDFGYDLKQHLRLKNPLSIEQAYLRSSLMPSLVTAVAKNAHYSKNFGLFEASKVYQAGTNHKKLPDEPQRVGIVRRGGYGPVKAALDLLAADFKLDFSVLAKPRRGLHPLRSAEVALNGKVIGWIGEIHPQVTSKHKITGPLGYLEIDLAPVFAQANQVQFRPIGRFPSITRDLALVVPQSVTWAQVKHVIADLSLCQAAFLNDYYGKDLPKGTKSLAVRLTFASMERTLKEEEADEGAKRVLAALSKTLGAKLR